MPFAFVRPSFPNSLVLHLKRARRSFSSAAAGLCSFFWASHAIKMKEQGRASMRSAAAEIMLQISDQNQDNTKTTTERNHGLSGHEHLPLLAFHISHSLFSVSPAGTAKMPPRPPTPGGSGSSAAAAAAATATLPLLSRTKTTPQRRQQRNRRGTLMTPTPCPRSDRDSLQLKGRQLQHQPYTLLAA